MIFNHNRANVVRYCARPNAAILSLVLAMLGLAGGAVNAANATFTEAGATLNLSLSAGQTATVTSTSSPSYTLVLSTGTWSGSNSINVNGNGTSTLTITVAGQATYTTAINITDSGADAAIAFADSGANTYVNNFSVTFSQAGATATQASFTGATNFAGSSALSVTVNRNIVINPTTIVGTVNGALTLQASQGNTISGSYDGINIAGTVQSTGTGVVTIKGNSGTTSSGDGWSGIKIHDGGTISGGTSGT